MLAPCTLSRQLRTASWERLEASCWRLERVLERFRAPWMRLGGVLRRIGSVWERLGHVFGLVKTLISLHASFKHHTGALCAFKPPANSVLRRLEANIARRVQPYYSNQ